jgi:hypothetical protein
MLNGVFILTSKGLLPIDSPNVHDHILLSPKLEITWCGLRHAIWATVHRRLRNGTEYCEAKACFVEPKDAFDFLVDSVRRSISEAPLLNEAVSTIPFRVADLDASADWLAEHGLSTVVYE